MRKLRLIILLVVVIALAVCCFFLLKDNSVNSEDEGAADTSFTVKSVAEEIEKISLINTEGVFGFEKKDGEWYNIFTVSVKTEGNAIYGIESILKQTIALDEIEKDVSSMSKYGLDNPAVTVRYETLNGGGFLKIGNSVVGTKYYFTVDDATVYTMDMSDAGLFFAGMSAFCDMTLMNTEIANLKKVTLHNGEEEIIVEKKSDSELADGTAGALFSFALRSPVKENASPNDVQALFERASSIGAASYDPYADEEETGISDSMRFFICETQEESAKFILGKSAGNGYTYLKKDGVRGVYKVSDEVAGIMDYTAFDLVDKHIALYYFDEIDSISIDAFGESYNMVLGESVTLNGKEIEKEAAQDFFKSLISLSYEGNVNKETESSAREITITFVRDGKKDVTSYVPYDAMNYAVLRNGACEFTIQRKFLEKIIDLVKEL